MRRARGLRPTSTRDICVFCATRPLATATPRSPPHSSTPQRLFNSSGRSPESAEGVLYKDAAPPSRPMSQAEQMRQVLAASAGPAPSALPQQPYMSQAQRMRAALAAQAPPPNTLSGQRQAPPSLQQQSPFSPQRQPLPSRPPINGGARLDEPVRKQSNARFTPNFTRGAVGNANAEPRAPPQSRYNISMNGRPQVSSPAFELGNLRRRNDPQTSEAMGQRGPISSRPLPNNRSRLDQDELARLLGNASGQKSSKPYQPLSWSSNSQRKCLHCGSVDHQSLACPVKPRVREQPQARKPDLRPSFNPSGPTTRQFDPRPSLDPRSSLDPRPSLDPSGPTTRQLDPRPSFDRSGPTTVYRPPQRYQESVADAAENWASKSKNLEIDSPLLTQAQLEEDGRRRNVDERRRRRFEMDEPEQAVNRYEQPERRRHAGRGRRVMRDEYEDEDEDRPQMRKQDRKKQRAAEKKLAQEETRRNNPTPILLPEFISVANLAGALRQKAEDFVRKLEDLGFEDVQNDHILNAEHAGLIAQEYNFEPIFQTSDDDGDLYPAPAPEPEVYAELPARPPVVTIMGHVDHGKTTILDYIRSTSVAATEFGGITQHIGAFSVPLANGRKITFLDTPGHAAFETMRARGANVTDIVVLVVAADDSVMPQTVEAIKHAQSAKVPIIVAINKIDKAQADVEAVKLDLGRHGIEVEDFGGDVQAIGVSGKTGQGIPDLEEAITTLSEMLDHRADPTTPVEGWVLEGTTKKSGRTATVLVRSGTLRQGTALVAGTTWTRVRTLRNEAGVIVKEVGPGTAVEVDGWRDQPIAGDEVLQADDEQHASSVADLRVEKVERKQMAVDMEAINEYRRLEAERRAAEEAAANALAAGEDPSLVDEALKPTGPALLNLIIKGDVSGSVEAVIDSVSALGNAEVATRILRSGVGAPSEFDIIHAADARGHIVNFNTFVPPHVAKLAEEKGVRILDSNIIYRVVETVKEVLGDMLTPTVVQKVTGEAEVAALFDITISGRNKMKVAGSKVRNGLVERGHKARVLRGNQVVYVGTIQGIRNHKKDVEQMRKDTECGIAFTGWGDFKIGDKIQCYDEWNEKRTL